MGHSAAEANAKTIIADWLMEMALPVLAAVDGGQLAVEYMGFIEQASLWQLQQHQKAGESRGPDCKLPCCGNRPCVAATTAPRGSFSPPASTLLKATCGAAAAPCCGSLSSTRTYRSLATCFMCISSLNSMFAQCRRIAVATAAALGGK